MAIPHRDRTRELGLLDRRLAIPRLETIPFSIYQDKYRRSENVHWDEKSKTKSTRKQRKIKKFNPQCEPNSEPINSGMAIFRTHFGNKSNGRWG